MRRDNLRAIVGSTVLDLRNRWVSIVEVTYLTEASARQISSILSQIPDIDLESQHTVWGRSIKLNADDEEARRIWRHLMHWRYHVDDVYVHLYGIIPVTGWISIRDLASEAHMIQSDVIKCLGWMGNDVQVKGANRQMMCCRIGDTDVSEHKGTAEPGDLVSERR